MKVISGPFRRRFALFLSGGALLITALASAQAATYYVDPDHGRDDFSGTAPQRTGAAGPWRTLAKVASAPLAPGDLVMLRCGAQWRETLNLTRGGTSAAPIRVAAYPARCPTKPAIDGGLPVPAHAWERHAGNIYKVRLPFTEVPGGDLGAQLTGWQLSSGQAGASVQLVSSCPAQSGTCTAMTAGGGAAVLSGPAFAVAAGQAYKLRYQVWSPVGGRVGVAVRLDSSRLRGVAAFSTPAGTGSWQDVSFDFKSETSASDARVHFDIPAGQKSYFRLARVERVLESGFDVFDMSAPGDYLRTAHHPNYGHNAAAPESVYLKTGVSNYVKGPDGRYGSTYIVTDTDLVLPAGVTLTPGIQAWVRSQIWSIKRHDVTSISGNRLYLSSQTSYPLIYRGWGYFLTGALWMLDSPGEWFYDKASQTAYVWMGDGAVPQARVTLSTLASGVKIGDVNIGNFPGNIVIDGLAIRNVAEGVSMPRMSDITLRRLALQTIAGFGIEGENTRRLWVDASTFTNIGSDAIHGHDAADARVTGNTITNSGVVVDATGTVRSLPREAYHAIYVGARSSVSDNQITNVGYNGILVTEGSSVTQNSVRNFAITLNDGGGLYSAGSTNAVIRGNVAVNGVGNTMGVPAGLNSLVSGIYMDDKTGAMVLSGNTFVGSDYCVKLHNAFMNTLENNTCYGSRRGVLHLQETSKSLQSTGNLYGNTVRGNLLFQTTTGPAVVLESSLTTISDFASFNGNAYSTLVSPIVRQHAELGQRRSFTMPELRLHGDQTGTAIETTGQVAAPLRTYARGLLGSGLVSPQDAATSWSRIGNGSPTITFGPTCGPGSRPCVSFWAGTTRGSLTGPRFPIVQGQTYRISFDAMVSDANQGLNISVLRAGPTYESLMGLEPYLFSGSTSWKRYSFSFRASATASNARIDFNEVLTGNTLRVANLEVVPYQPTGVDSESTILVNSERVAQSFACPTQVSQPAACSRFFTFPEGQRVTWPLTLAARTGRIVFSQDDSLRDADGDGVTDQQDACPGTPADAAVDTRGCALGQ